MNILVVRAFVKLREVLANHGDLAIRIEKIEADQEQHAPVINILAEEIEGLKQLPAEPPKRRIRSLGLRETVKALFAVR